MTCNASATIKPVFQFNHSLANVEYLISLFCEHSDRTNDMDTIDYATFCYHTTQVENGL